jgi:hypothetical protein
MEIMVLWDVTPCSLVNVLFYLKDQGSKLPQNIGTDLPVYMIHIPEDCDIQILSYYLAVNCLCSSVSDLGGVHIQIQAVFISPENLEHWIFLCTYMTFFKSIPDTYPRLRRLWSLKIYIMYRDELL